MAIINIGRVMDKAQRLMSEIDVENYLVAEILGNAISAHEAEVIWRTVRRSNPSDRISERFSTVERDRTNG